MPEIVAGAITCETALANVIQSIALEEAGIAHIINAEGEKIQKCVELAENCEDLIDVNESVSDTLKNIIKLQMLLQFKLENAMDFECDNGGNHGHCKKSKKD